MDFRKVRVLVTDGGARQTLTIVRGLKDIGCHVSVLCSSRLDVCYASRLPDEKILNEHAAGSYDGFEELLASILATGKYDVLLPIAELTTNKVTWHEDEYKRYVKIACAPRAAYIQAFNKQHTFEQAMKNGIPCPYTRSEDRDVEDYLQHAHFPIIIKPRQGVGSIGFHKFETEKEFEEFLKDQRINLDDYVLQEFVHFKRRIGTGIFMDQEGNVTTAYAVEVLRWYPIDAGAGVLIRSVEAPDAIRYSCDLLKAMGWRGFANVALMIDEETGDPKLMEINGRIPASIKMSYLCGFNVAKQLIELAYDEKVTSYPSNKNLGILTRHSQADFTWFLKSKERFRSKPSWFSWKDTKDVVFWRDDPLPFFSYTIQRTFRFREISRKKKH